MGTARGDGDANSAKDAGRKPGAMRDVSPICSAVRRLVDAAARPAA